MDEDPEDLLRGGGEGREGGKREQQRVHSEVFVLGGGHGGGGAVAREEPPPGSALEEPDLGREGARDQGPEVRDQSQCVGESRVRQEVEQGRAMEEDLLLMLLSLSVLFQPRPWAAFAIGQSKGLLLVSEGEGEEPLAEGKVLWQAEGGSEEDILQGQSLEDDAEAGGGQSEVLRALVPVAGAVGGVESVEDDGPPVAANRVGLGMLRGGRCRGRRRSRIGSGGGKFLGIFLRGEQLQHLRVSERSRGGEV
jgi:hypothetical protein